MFVPDFPDKAELLLTLLMWVLAGSATGLFMKRLMPVPNDGGVVLAAGIGVVCASIGGGLAVAYLGGGITGMNWHSVAWAINGALYSLFIFRCFAMRTQ